MMEHDLDQWEFAGQFGVGMPELPPEAPNVFHRPRERRDHQHDLSQPVDTPHLTPQPNLRTPRDVVRQQNEVLIERSRRLRDGEDEGRQRGHGRRGGPRMGLLSTRIGREDTDQGPPAELGGRGLMRLWDVDDNWQMLEWRG